MPPTERQQAAITAIRYKGERGLVTLFCKVNLLPVGSALLAPATYMLFGHDSVNEPHHYVSNFRSDLNVIQDV